MEDYKLYTDEYGEAIFYFLNELDYGNFYKRLADIQRRVLDKGYAITKVEYPYIHATLIEQLEECD